MRFTILRIFRLRNKRNAFTHSKSCRNVDVVINVGVESLILGSSPRPTRICARKRYTTYFIFASYMSVVAEVGKLDTTRTKNPYSAILTKSAPRIKHSPCYLFVGSMIFMTFSYETPLPPFLSSDPGRTVIRYISLL